jgi:hypothetical protein
MVELATPKGTKRPNTALVIESEERRKTDLGSVGGRTHGRPDERSNPLGSGRTDRNWSEELRVNLTGEEHG